jgi:hypothetical protein
VVALAPVDERRVTAVLAAENTIDKRVGILGRGG